ncbi:MAG: hypothetical protein Q8Q32_02380 [bacterium]|nr:hypothetical protein [bacterium]
MDRLKGKARKIKNIRVRRGFRMRAVLETISDIPEEILCAFGAFLSAGYGASGSRVQYEYDKLKRDRPPSVSTVLKNSVAEKRNLQNYWTLISRLKRDGLIAEKNGKILRTIKGRLKLEELRKGSLVMPDVRGYKRPSGSLLVIFSFDVPEKHRVKRGWLRSALINLGFKKVQQSVFVGKGPLPKEFVDDIGKMDLSEAVEIFEVSRKGTLSSYKLD